MPAPQWTPPTQPQFQAADSYADIVVAALRKGDSLHPGTAIAAIARMAGTFMFRSFNWSLKGKGVEPGAVVLSDDANNCLPGLINTLGAGLQVLNVNLDGTKLDQEVPKGHLPRISVNETQSLLEAQFRDVSASLNLTAEQSAHACALAAGILIRDCTSVLDPHVGFNAAVRGFVEGAKTAPIPLEAEQIQGQPWYKFWK